METYLVSGPDCIPPCNEGPTVRIMRLKTSVGKTRSEKGVYDEKSLRKISYAANDKIV